jgi:chaperonin GroEL
MVILDGGGDPAAIQERMADIRTKLMRTTDRDQTLRLRERLASLVNGSGILQLGGLTDAERDEKRRHVERALRILPEIIGAGTVPGGGLALLACRPALDQHRTSLGLSDQRFGAEIMACGLEAPFRQLVTNSGALRPGVVLHRVLDGDEGLAFDAASATLIPAAELAMSDSLSVLRGALRTATSAVAELITTGVAILPHERRRPVSTTP